MEMFNRKVTKERIGSLEKNKVLDHLREVEKYFLLRMRDYDTEYAYDVVAQEMPYFKTLGYTEYATCFLIGPLNLELRAGQIDEASATKPDKILDFASYFKNNIEQKVANKYADRKSVEADYPEAGHLVVLPGSNKLKERACLNKLRYIKDLHDTDVYFKPHPLTTYQLIGELKDIFGPESILPRDADLYEFLVKAHTVYTTHISESALYASILDKKIEPIDVYNTIERGSFYTINRHLFNCQAFGLDPKK